MTRTYQIDKGVPLPTHGFPLADMRPGESFALSADQEELQEELSDLQNTIPLYRTKRFIIGKWEDAYRCWRVE